VTKLSETQAFKKQSVYYALWGSAPSEMNIAAFCIRGRSTQQYIRSSYGNSIGLSLVRTPQKKRI
jgi:hypothetical protein